MFNSITKTQAFFMGAAVASVVYTGLDLLEAELNDRLTRTRLEKI